MARHWIPDSGKIYQNGFGDFAMKIRELFEFSSAGVTSAGSIASIPNAGGPMMPVIRRMPAGQSFFGPAGTGNKTGHKHQRKPKKKSKTT